MSRKHLSLTVIFDNEIGDEYITDVSNAIKLLKGVQQVVIPDDYDLGSTSIVRLNEQLKIRKELIDFAIRIGKGDMT